MENKPNEDGPGDLAKRVLARVRESWIKHGDPRLAESRAERWKELDLERERMEAAGYREEIIVTTERRWVKKE